MGKKEDKTNVMRILDQKKIEYNHYSYDNMTQGVALTHSFCIKRS